MIAAIASPPDGIANAFPAGTGPSTGARGESPTGFDRCRVKDLGCGSMPPVFRTHLRRDRSGASIPPAGPQRARRPGSHRGSAVITVLVLAAVTAVIASSFMFRSTQEAKLATRSYFQTAALNLAEAGIEEGLFAANTSTFTTAEGWSLANGSTTDYVKSLTTGFNLQQATGAVYVRVDNATTLEPVVIAAGVISIPNQRSVVKQIRVSATKRHLWSNGMVAKNTLTFSGNAAIDSYDSSVGVYNSATNRGDQATVATASTALDPIVVGSNASIYGYVATGANDPEVGSGGRIYGATTPSGTLVDSSRIRRDFTANLPDASAPTGSATALAAISSSLTLPRTGDTPGTNGRYLYTTTSVSLSGNNTLSVLGPVDLIVTGGVAVSGNGSLSVGGTGSTNPSMNLYSPGTISIAGNGMINLTNTPANSTIWGTATSGATQTVTITGNGSFTGTVYAPNANLTLSGNGGNSGAVIAKTVTVGGNGQFHYDIQLSTLHATVDTSFRVTAWAELTAVSSSGAVFARDNRAPFTGIF